MNHYQISSPRKAFALVSVALTAITIVLAVIVPARMQGEPRDVRELAALTVTAPAQVEVVRDRIRVDVMGSREPEFTTVQAPTPLPKRRQDS